ncbi:MAG: hypothetical protein WCH57_05835 [Verrucomicrobiota bacterium]
MRNIIKVFLSRSFRPLLAGMALACVAVLSAPRMASAGDAQCEKWLAFTERTLQLVEKSAPRPELRAKYLQLLERNRNKQPVAIEEIRALRREIILSHPALQFNDILFNANSVALKTGFPGAFLGHMVDSFLAGNQQGPVPGIAVLQNWKSQPSVRYLTKEALPPGVTLRPDLFFDGSKVVFAYAPESEDLAKKTFRIYEIGLDGSGLRQITGTPRDPDMPRLGRATHFIEDMDPCYLPDGGFAFTSTRVMTTVRCVAGQRYNPAFVLHRCDGDGSNVRALSFGELNEYNPTLLPDGRLLYTRWEYINRSIQFLHKLWATNTDGTGTAYVYGNNTLDPNLVMHARPIPGTRDLIATATAHHNVRWGTIIRIRPELGADGLKPLVMLTPEARFPEFHTPEYLAKNREMKPDENGIYPFGFPYALTDKPEQATLAMDAGWSSYMMPYPLTEELFLVCGNHGGRSGIYLADTLGGRELIYQDQQFDATFPIPVQPRPMPAARPVASPSKEIKGQFYIQDVYQNRFDHAGRIARGSVKSLRVIEILDQATQNHNPDSYYAFETPKRVLGTVPVQADGSVFFEAPAGAPLSFQLLDGNSMAVMTMRSMVYLQPGETASCVGCHENRSAAPANRSGSRLPPLQKLRPPLWANYPGGFSFARTVQPVLDRYCISCHGPDKSRSEKALFALTSQPLSYGTWYKNTPENDVVLPWPGITRFKAAAAYKNLVDRPQLIGKMDYAGESVTSKPFTYVAHSSRLAPMLKAGHHGVTLDPESWERLTTWMDLNVPYAGDYSFNRLEDREIDPARLAELHAAVAELTGRPWQAEPAETLINVADPLQSRVLLAPLAVSAGGWGQEPVRWQSQQDPGFVRMRQLVEACIKPLPFQDIKGTCGRGSKNGCQCRSCWVRERLEKP